MKIITLTLNPAFDVHCTANGFLPYHESIVQITSREAGGKGVNISRALTAAGRKSTAVVIVGKENGDEFCRMLERDALSFVPILQDGRIRENLTLHEDHNPETRISFGGFALTDAALCELEHLIGAIGTDTVVTFTGSIPSGTNARPLLSMLQTAKKKGAKIVIDSRSVTLSEILDFKPWLIKPNRDEIEAYIGKSVETTEDAVQIAKTLCASGIENVMISLGKNGAVLATSEDCFYAKAPTIDVISTIGAGDSMIAGFIDAICEGLSPQACLTRAVAFGTAACLRNGTKPPIPTEIEAFENQIISEKINL